MVVMATPYKHPDSGIYYLRKAVPKDVQDIIGKTFFKESLKTRDPREAKALFAERLAWAESLIRTAREEKTHISSRQANALAGAWLKKALRDDEEFREAGGAPDEESRPSVGEFDPYDVVLDLIGEEAGKGRGIVLVESDIKETLEAHGIALHPDRIKESPDLISQFLEAKHRYYRILQDRMSGRWRQHQIEKEYPEVTLGTPRAPLVSSGGKTLSALWEEWTLETNTRKKTQDEYKKALTEFEKINNTLPVDVITKAHIRAYKDKLLKKGLKAGTINKKMGAVRSLLKFAVDNGYIQSNPADGFRVKDTVSARDKRLAYSRAELKEVFSLPVFTKGDRPRGGGGEAAYWIPHLALYTGARLNEIGQLVCEDIQETEGVHYIEITDLRRGKEETKIKTRAARRIIPVHARIIDKGFLEYVQTIKRKSGGDSFLFPELTANHYGSLTQNWSRWWRRYLEKETSINDSRKVFHSFRHNFMQACREAEVPAEKRKAMMGHSDKDVSFSYGGWSNSNGLSYPFSPMALDKEIKKISFDIH